MSAPEEWRAVPGYNGAYEVSDLGRVRSWLPCQGTAVPRVRKPAVDTNGYPTVRLRQDGASKNLRVHRLVMEAFVGPRPDDMETRHLNGDQSDNRLDNLAYGTSTENNYDQLRHGTNSRVNITHCPQGHEYSVANTRVVTVAGRNPFRLCKACEADRQRARRARRRAEAVTS